MAGTSKGCVFRPTVTRTRSGKKVRTRARFYWAKYRDAAGIEVRHALKLSNGDGVKDKGVARELLRAILLRVERESAGLIDPMIEAAGLPIRAVLARYLRHLRGQLFSRKHMDQVRSYLKWLIENGSMYRLADFNTQNIDQLLRKVADKGRSPRTVNVYRQRAHAFGE